MSLGNLELRMLCWEAALQQRGAALARERPSPPTRVAPLAGRRMGDPMGPVAGRVAPRSTRRRLNSPPPYAGDIATESVTFATATVEGAAPPAVPRMEPSEAWRPSVDDSRAADAETAPAREARADDTEH